MRRSSSTRPPERRGHRPLLAVLAVATILLAAIGGAALLLAGGARPVGQIDPGTSGRLVATQPTIDLGQVPFDKPTEARFELANTGGETVRLVGAPKVRMLEGC